MSKKRTYDAILDAIELNATGEEFNPTASSAESRKIPKNDISRDSKGSTASEDTEPYSQDTEVYSEEDDEAQDTEVYNQEEGEDQDEPELVELFEMFGSFDEANQLICFEAIPARATRPEAPGPEATDTPYFKAPLTRTAPVAATRPGTPWAEAAKASCFKTIAPSEDRPGTSGPEDTESPYLPTFDPLSTIGEDADFIDVEYAIT